MAGDGSATARQERPWGAALGFVRAFADYAGWRGVRAAALVGLAALVEGATIMLLVPILGVVVPGGVGGVWRGRLNHVLTTLGATTPLAQLALLLTAFVLVVLLRAVILLARDIVLSDLQAGFVETLRNRLIRTLAAAPWSAIVSLRHARVTNMLGPEMQRVGSSGNFLVQGSVALMLLIVQGALACALAPRFAAGAVALLAVGGSIALMTLNRTRNQGRDVLRESQALTGSAAAFLGGLKAAAAQNGQGLFVAEFAAIQTRMRALQLGFQRRQSRARAAFGVGSSVGGAAVVLGGVAFGVSAPVLIALVLIFSRMSGPAQQVQQALQNFFFTLPSFEGIDQLERDLVIDAGPPAPVIVPPPGPVVLHDVRYLHPGGGGVRHASLSIAPGTFLGVTGPSGAGKTTLIDVLIGLLAPQSGTMTIGGMPADAALLAGWREGVAYVPQDGFLFHDSVRRNLAWGDAPIDDAAFAGALMLAGADVLVERLPQGLETVIGERGAMLSGGERQRIALARALLRQPRFLVLDEAANAIDAAGEAALLARLAALDPRPTIVMISHRAESMALCDRSIRVDQGVLTEDPS